MDQSLFFRSVVFVIGGQEVPILEKYQKFSQGMNAMYNRNQDIDIYLSEFVRHSFIEQNEYRLVLNRQFFQILF